MLHYPLNKKIKFINTRFFDFKNRLIYIIINFESIIIKFHRFYMWLFEFRHFQKIKFIIVIRSCIFELST